MMNRAAERAYQTSTGSWRDRLPLLIEANRIQSEWRALRAKVNAHRRARPVDDTTPTGLAVRTQQRSALIHVQDIPVA